MGAATVAAANGAALLKPGAKVPPEDVVDGDEADESSPAPSGDERRKPSASQKKREKKKEKRRAKQQQQQHQGDLAPADGATGISGKTAPLLDKQPGKSMPKVEIEYVAAQLDVTDPAFADFAKVFERFRAEDAASATGPEPDVEAAPEAGAEDSPAQASDDDGDGAEKPTGTESASEDENGARPLSKKKLRKEARLTVAELKQLVRKPEVVEWVDVTAADPALLVHLKSLRNTVPVPKHWSQKRKYLQNKRGLEKAIFELPEMRDAVREKEESMKMRQKMRERVQPKRGKLEIDYQKLHDAFFKYQQKPLLTIHGELYYEGKEFEPKYKDKRPGDLSEDLKTALNIPPGAPPPWLINMQRYGPPPSYPQMKIPGLNAPIPPGAQWGFHPGGWGKPPVDEFGRPLYGDVSGSAAVPPPPEAAPVEKKPWGALEVYEEEEEEEEEEEGEEVGTSDEEKDEDDGLVTPSGFASTTTTTTTTQGMETPDVIELRKDVRRGEETPDGGPKALYTVLPTKENKLSGFMGSAHVYDIANAKAARQVEDEVQVALDPSELENLDSADLQAKYEQQRAADREDETEDFSDLVAEHAAQQSKKRKKAQDAKAGAGASAAKKYKDFKF